MGVLQKVTEDGEVFEAGTLAMLDTRLVVEMTRAEIDQQIAAAHQFPRSVKRASNNILSLATLDEGAAEECMYALPRGGKPIVGPSIRLAEIVSGQWGNNRVAARVVDVNRTEKYVEAEGVFHDLETNAAVMARVRRRIVDKRGNLFNDDMIIVTGNAACAIARRNAILAGVPKAVWRRAYESAEGVVKGDVRTLAETREKGIKALAAFGVKPEQVYGALGIAGDEEVTLDHIPVLRGMFQALKNGESTVEEMFDPRRGVKAPAKAYNPLKDEPVDEKGVDQVETVTSVAGSTEARTNGPASSSEQLAAEHRPQTEAAGEGAAASDPAATDAAETAGAEEEGEREVDTKDPDYQAGYAYFVTHGKTRCLTTEIVDDPKRLLRWQVGAQDANLARDASA